MNRNHLYIESGVALAAGVLDHVAGSAQDNNRRTNPEFHMRAGKLPTGNSSILFSGCQTDGGALFDSLSPMVPHADLLVASYPEKGFDVEEVCEGLAKQIEQGRAHKPSLIGQSMGGMVISHFVEYADRTGLLDKTEGFGDIILDASPYDGDDVRLLYKALLGGASIFKDSWTVNRLKPTVMNRISKEHDWSARTSLSAIKAQGQFILGAHPRINLARFAESVEYHHGAGQDPVINTDQAAMKYQAYSINEISEVIDSRPTRSHTATIGHLAAMINQTVLRRENEPVRLSLVPDKRPITEDLHPMELKIAV